MRSLHRSNTASSWNPTAPGRSTISETNFSSAASTRKLIENGKVTRTVRNPNYRGITVPFWQNLKMVGDASTREVFGTPNCGKGEPNQIIRVGHASPACMFENVEVFGGAS